MAEGGSFRATEESAATGVRRVKRRDSRTEDRPALTSPRGLSAPPPGRAGLGAEARASVGSQGEDWGWRRERPEGASVPQLAGRESGKSLELPKRQENIVSGCTRRGDSGNCLNELQKRVRAVALSADPRDRHETLMLLLPPPRSLCASTGHSPHLPSRSLCSPPLPWSRDAGTTSLGEHTVNLRLLQRHAGLCRRRLAPPPPYPSLLPA